MSRFKNNDISDADWESFAGNPLIFSARDLHKAISFKRIHIPAYSPVLELSLKRKLRNFERHPEEILSMLKHTVDGIAGAHDTTTIPSHTIYYGPPEIAGFSWQQAGFAVRDGADLPADMYKHPETGLRLTDKADDPNRVVTAVISTVRLLQNCGYEIS